uniref:Uncharacterized protein n=1 Tax=Romanomermis culicivorax TaxID=13658 RepID=A0A915JF48_ROMCU
MTGFFLATNIASTMSKEIIDSLNELLNSLFFHKCCTKPLNYEAEESASYHKHYSLSPGGQSLNKTFCLIKQQDCRRYAKEPPIILSVDRLRHPSYQQIQALLDDHHYYSSAASIPRASSSSAVSNYSGIGGNGQWCCYYNNDDFDCLNSIAFYDGTEQIVNSLKRSA